METVTEVDELELELEETEDLVDEWEEAEVEFNPSGKYSKKELEEWADTMLREDANRELCRVCVENAKKISPPGERSRSGVTANERISRKTDLPYGEETGHVEWKIQYDQENLPLLDEDDNAMYVGFPELKCEKGHRWYKGEGPRRDIRGRDPILFESHLFNRKRREIHVKDGIPDPAFTMDRWGKRPIQGIYNRVHPLGRKVNTPEQRTRNGAAFTDSCLLVKVAGMGLKPRFPLLSIGEPYCNRHEEETMQHLWTE